MAGMSLFGFSNAQADLRIVFAILRSLRARSKKTGHPIDSKKIKLY